MSYFGTSLSSTSEEPREDLSEEIFDELQPENESKRKCPIMDASYEALKVGESEIMKRVNSEFSRDILHENNKNLAMAEELTDGKDFLRTIVKKTSTTCFETGNDVSKKIISANSSHESVLEIIQCTNNSVQDKASVSENESCDDK